MFAASGLDGTRNRAQTGRGSGAGGVLEVNREAHDNGRRERGASGLVALYPLFQVVRVTGHFGGGQCRWLHSSFRCPAVAGGPWGGVRVSERLQGRASQDGAMQLGGRRAE